MRHRCETCRPLCLHCSMPPSCLHMHSCSSSRVAHTTVRQPCHLGLSLRTDHRPLGSGLTRVQPEDLHVSERVSDVMSRSRTTARHVLLRLHVLLGYMHYWRMNDKPSSTVHRSEQLTLAGLRCLARVLQHCAQSWRKASVIKLIGLRNSALLTSARLYLKCTECH